MSLPVNDKGNLLIAGRDVTELAAKYGTPLFLYDVDQIRRNVDNYRRAFDGHPVPRVVTADPDYNASPANMGAVPYQIAYASKALSITAIYEVMRRERNVSVDVVSSGELYTALHAGVDPRKIHFHGNNKSEEEIRYALESGIGCFVVDSFHEIDLLQRLTRELFGAGTDDAHPQPQRRYVNVLLRVSPGVTAHTHEYNMTGQVDSKFGFDVISGQAQQAYELVSGRRATANGKEGGGGGDNPSQHLRVIGLHCHIGSQIFTTEGHVLAARRLLQLAADWGMIPGEEVQPPRNDTTGNDGVNDDGEGGRFVLNVGGGYGIAYTAEDAPPPSRAFIDALLNTVAAVLAEQAAANAADPSSQAARHVSGKGYRFPEIWIEPGRSLVGAAGTTLYTVGARKTIPTLHKHYVAVDGGMSDNIRPVLYQAQYTAYIANRMDEHRRFAALTAKEQAAELAANTLHSDSTPIEENRERGCNGNVDGEHTGGGRTGMGVFTVVGKLCETGDQLIKDAPLPCGMQPGDIMAVMCTGAYGYAMASNYNRMRRPAILFLEGSGGAAGSAEPRERIVVRRETYEDLVHNDVSFYP